MEFGRLFMAVTVFVHERSDFIIEEPFGHKSLCFQMNYSLEKNSL